MDSLALRKKNSHWIASAELDKHKGALHRSLGIPTGTKIPLAKLKSAAAGGDTKLARRARLALTMRSFKH